MVPLDTTSFWEGNFPGAMSVLGRVSRFIVGSLLILICPRMVFFFRDAFFQGWQIDESKDPAYPQNEDLHFKVRVEMVLQKGTCLVWPADPLRFHTWAVCNVNLLTILAESVTFLTILGHVFHQVVQWRIPSANLM